MAGVVKRAYKYRCYPSAEQAEELNRIFGCVRLVWNKALDARGKRYAAEYTRSAFRWREGRLTLAKMTEPLDIRWSRSLPGEPSTVTVSRDHARIADRRIDFLHKLSTRLIRENQAIAIEDLTVRTMVANHTLARSISGAGWR